MVWRVYDPIAKLLAVTIIKWSLLSVLWDRCSYNIGASLMSWRKNRMPGCTHPVWSWSCCGHDDFLDDYIAYKICCEDDDDDSSDGCYIATAVYGTYDCPELWVLRRFRDYGLRKSIIGTAFVQFYYAVSPRLVRRFRNAERINRVSKSVLDLLVRQLKKHGFEETPYFDRWGRLIWQEDDAVMKMQRLGAWFTCSWSSF